MSMITISVDKSDSNVFRTIIDNVYQYIEPCYTELIGQDFTLC